MQEQMDLANEIGDAISRPVGETYDEDDLTAELDEIEREELDSKLTDECMYYGLYIFCPLANPYYPAIFSARLDRFALCLHKANRCCCCRFDRLSSRQIFRRLSIRRIGRNDELNSWKGLWTLTEGFDWLRHLINCFSWLTTAHCI